MNTDTKPTEAPPEFPAAPLVAVEDSGKSETVAYGRAMIRFDDGSFIFWRGETLYLGLGEICIEVGKTDDLRRLTKEAVPAEPDEERCGYCGSDGGENGLAGSLNSPNGSVCLDCAVATT